MAIKNRSAMRKVRHKRIRKRIHGTPERPRLAVFRSNKHIYAQVIDDTTGSTLAAASSLEATLSASKTVEGAEKVGQEIAKRAKEKGVKHVIFDRGGLRYHGAVATLAEGARKGGIDF